MAEAASVEASVEVWAQVSVEASVSVAASVEVAGVGSALASGCSTDKPPNIDHYTSEATIPACSYTLTTSCMPPS